MARHVGHQWTLDPDGGVVPAEGGARRVVLRVAAIAGEGGPVDPADERDSVVDDNRLLVVAVERPLTRVECAADRAGR